MSIIIPVVDNEFRHLIPPLSAEEYAQLEQNIISGRKCHDPIVLWGSVIVDGYNRFEICTRHGIEFEVKEMPFNSREEAKVWILENQLGRRNLTDAMRIEIVLLKADMLREKAKKKLSWGGKNKNKAKNGVEPLSEKTKPPGSTINVRKTLAAEADVSEGTLYNYTQIKEHGSPELLAQVKSGKVKIDTAHRMLYKELTKKLGLANKMYNYIWNRLPFIKDDSTTQDIHNRLTGLSNLLQELIDNWKESTLNENT